MPNPTANSNPELSATSIAATILAIERNLVLSRDYWTVGDLHLWPLYRMELYRRMFLDPIGAAAAQKVPHLYPALQACAASSGNANAKANIWIVSDGASYVQLGELYYDRFCGPIHAALAALGQNSVIIDRASEIALTTQEPTRWWTPLTVRAKTIGGLRAKLAPDQRHDRINAELQAAAKVEGVTLPNLGKRRLDAKARAVLWLAKRLEKRLKSERVSLLFTVCFYDVAGFAYLLASKRAGTVTVDIQHGVTGPHHLAYANWNPLCSTLLPTFYWSWSEADAQVVRDWAQLDENPKHFAAVGGHPFINAWQSRAIELPESTSKEITNLLRSSEKPRVLVTLQPGLLSKGTLRPLLEALSIETHIFWWIRLHPTDLDQAQNIAQLLRELQAHNWESVLATKLPLPALLMNADAHVTHSSSTVIEAGFFGVPSIVWSRYGSDLFQSQIANGSAFSVTNGAELLARLREVILFGKDRSSSEDSRGLDTLRTLISFSHDNNC